MTVAEFIEGINVCANPLQEHELEIVDVYGEVYDGFLASDKDDDLRYWCENNPHCNEPIYNVHITWHKIIVYIREERK